MCPLQEHTACLLLKQLAVHNILLTNKLLSVPNIAESLLCQFVGHLGKQNLKHQTIKSYLSDIRYFQIVNCFTDPFIRDMPRLQYVLRGIRLEEARLNRQPRQRLPVTVNVLRKVHSILLLDPNNFDNIMLWEAFLLCFFGFLRSGEVTIPDQNSYDPQFHLNFEDFSADNSTSPSLLKV